MSASDHDHDHEQLAGGVPTFPKKGPAKTVTIQRHYGSKLRGRFDEIQAEARRAILEQGYFDVFTETAEQLASSDWDAAPPLPRGGTAKDRIDAFDAWLARQHEQGVHSVIGEDRNPYLERAYSEGVNHADRELQQSSRYSVPAGVLVAASPPVKQKTMDVLTSRNYSLLVGITDDHANRVHQITSSAAVSGLQSDVIADELMGATDSARQRVTALARNEVMVGHNQAALDRFEQAGVEQVDVVTAANPCLDCVNVASDNPYSVSEARGLVPQHPNCQCSVVIRR